MAYTEGTHSTVYAFQPEFVAVCPLTATRAVLVYKIAGVAYAYAKVATVNGLDVTLGPQHTLTPTSLTGIGVCALDSTHFVIVHAIQGPTYVDVARVCTVSGNDITVGPASAELNTGYSIYFENGMGSISRIDSTHVLLHAGYGIGGEKRPCVWVGTVSGIDITWGTLCELYQVSCDANRVAVLSSSSAVAIYRQTKYSDYSGWAIALSISGTTVSDGTRVEYTGSSGDNHVQDNWVVPIDSTHACILWRDADDSNKGKYRIATVSGLDITFGAVGEFESGGMTNPTGDVAGMVDADSLRIAYSEADDDGHLKNGSVSGTTVSWQAGETVHSGTTGSISIARMDDNGLGLYMYVDEDDGDAKVFAFSDSEFTTTVPPAGSPLLLAPNKHGNRMNLIGGRQ